MILRNVARGELLAALEHVKEIYGQHIEFNSYKELIRINGYRVTLSVLDQAGPGALYTRPEVHGYPRPTHTACWHVHRDFFFALPDEALMKTGETPDPDSSEAVEQWLRVGDIPEGEGHYPAQLVGGPYFFYWMSNLCLCGNRTIADIVASRIVVDPKDREAGRR